MGVCEQSRPVVATEHLNGVAVTAAAQQVTSVWRDVEHAGMDCRGLVADASEQSGLVIHCKDGNAIVFQAIARV